ncbi:hypothetical protein DH2020_019762 [Rehmannia glutinosa]|uniref:Transposase MuDR plant domain-containing protein n=1 Tax=Rehmannia glutinosa TaxID=99300 RepID=A0ABR0WGD1_REHGL
MAKKIGLKEYNRIYCSKIGVDDCSELVLMQNDIDALNLVNYIDHNKMVGVFIENQCTNPNSIEFEFAHELPSIGEPLQFVGDDEDRIISNLDENDTNEIQGYDVSDMDIPQNDVFDNFERNGSLCEEEQFDDSDSEFSDKFADSDWDVSDDDVLFDSHIDEEVEWGGLNMSTQIAHMKGVSNDQGAHEDEMHNGCPIFNRSVDLVDPEFELGMCFKDTAEIREAIRQHVIKQGRDVIFTINDKFKVQAKCKHKTCPWVIYASKVQKEDTMQVKTFNGKHKCPRQQKVSHANARWLAVKYRDKIWSDPKWPIDSMITVMQKEQKLAFNKSQMYRTKRRVFKMGSASDNEQYGMLWSYAEEMKNTNPGTTKEAKNSWMWFIELLVQDLNIVNPHQWTIMSDKQKGLIDAIETLLPGCEHRFCVMHLYKNFKSAHKGLALKHILWKAARATTVLNFNRAIAELRDRNASAYDWLVKRPASHWSRSHFSTFPKSDILLNNMSESFNAMILAARSKPIVEMLEAIRLMLMKRIHVRRDQMSKYDGDICPKITKVLEELKKKSMDFIAHWT